LTTSGTTARLVSKYRPVCPIIMVSRNATACRVSPSHLHRLNYTDLCSTPTCTAASTPSSSPRRSPTSSSPHGRRMSTAVSHGVS
jgi:hypothetical protein